MFSRNASTDENDHVCFLPARDSCFGRAFFHSTRFSAMCKNLGTLTEELNSALERDLLD